MRSSRPVQLQEREQVATALQRVLWSMALVLGLPALVGGLLTLTLQPMLGVLLLIAAMAALLYSVDGFCRGPGVSRSMQSRK